MNRKSKVRNLKWLALGAMLLALSFPANAQQPKKVGRIGYLAAGTPSARAPYTEAFRQGLRDLGYIEGQNIAIEYRYAQEKLDRQPALAAELVSLKVDVILTAGASGTRSAREATNTIPIIMAQDPDPVGNGFVTSLARPGGNITGLSSLVAELGGKRLELLREVVPRLSRVAVLGTSTNPANAQQLREAELAAGPIGVRLQFLDVLDPKDIETGFRAATKGRADAVLVFGGPFFIPRRTKIAELAIKSRLPAIYNRSEFVEAGGLMTYGASIPDLYRRAATYVDKILKGTKPADLPVQQPIKFEFVINLKAAKQIGLTIPPNVLARADRVIR
ncbi:MAG: ABC transporter substrate-binding protein [Deltaproteobacteria bacterium]|nr:MAG: ABC transporter substrate-binding protein [Deltaproteobacteria bacterium]